MKRRKFIVGAAAGSLAGLSGCVNVLQDNEPNDTEEKPSNGTDDGDETDDGTGDTNDDSDGPTIETFTYSKRCESADTEQYASITNPANSESGEYEFSGKFIMTRKCQIPEINATVENGDLTVNITPNEDISNCKEDCTASVFFGGSVQVNDSVTVNSTTINTP